MPLVATRFLLASLFILSLPASAAAQDIITLRAGAGGRLMVSVGSKVMIPVVIDMSAAGSATFGSVQSGLSWGASRLTLDSIRTAGFGSLTQNTTSAATGSATISTFDVAGTVSTVTMANLYFSTSSSGGTTLALNPTVAGSATGGINILNLIRIRDLDVCVAPGSKWGDVNGDTLVNIIDAQQIARYGVGLSVGNAALLMVQGDVTNDGSVNVIDAQQIARFSVGLSTSVRTNTLAFTPPVVTTLTVPSVLDATSGSVNPGVPAALGALVSAKQAQLRPLAKDASTQDVTSCATITYSSSAPNVAAVSATGLITAGALGSATITVTSGTSYATVGVTVTALLGVMTQPSGVESGVVFSTQPVVAIRDAVGTTIAGATDSVRVTKASGTGTLSGTTTVAAVNGVATFTDLQIAGSGAHTLLFTATGSTSATSSSFSVTQTPTTLALATQPTEAANNVPFATQPVVRVLDRAGLVVAGNSTTVTASIASGTGVLGGTTSVPASNGVVTFSDLRITGLGVFTLSFSATGLISVTSSSVTVIGGSLRMLTQPAGAISNSFFNTQPEVEVLDEAGARQMTATNAVTVSLGSGSGILSGTRTVTAVAGVATFTDLAITGTGAHTLAFAASGLTVSASSLTVAAPTGYRLLVGDAPSQMVTNNVNVTIPLKAEIPAGVNLSSISMRVTWDPTKFTYVTTTAGTWSDGISTVDATGAASGTILFAIFSATGATTSVTLRNLTLTSINLTGSDITGTVTATVAVAGDEVGTTITVVPRNLQVTINP